MKFWSGMRNTAIVLGCVAIVSLGLIPTGSTNTPIPAYSQWQTVGQAAPKGLRSQLQKDRVVPGQLDPAQVDQMPFYKLQESGQASPLYLVYGKIASLSRSQANPLCGFAGCQFYIYMQRENKYVNAFEQYLDPNLPPSTPLIEVSSRRSKRLPCLQFNQLQSNRQNPLIKKEPVVSDTVCFDGKTFKKITPSNPRN
ncbi:MAG: hypothetical protein SFW36_17760 [Leptolyngbyaceae cyanobacterium bins.59]|nr:hypothetical protein [Leptolyngbyaceae cyanobacterium bins.59]